MAYAIPFIMYAGAAVGAVGGVMSAVQARNAGKYNAKLGEQNATLAEQRATLDEQRSRMLSRQHLGQMRANFGGNGLALEGSAEDIIFASERDAELDALLIRHNGRVQATAARNGANLAEYEGRTGYASNMLSAAGTLGLGLGKAAMAREELKPKPPGADYSYNPARRIPTY